MLSFPSWKLKNTSKPFVLRVNIWFLNRILTPSETQRNSGLRLQLLNVPYSAALQRDKGKKLIGLKELERASQLLLTYLRCEVILGSIFRALLLKGIGVGSKQAGKSQGSHRWCPSPQKHHCFPSLRSSDGVNPPTTSQARICSHPPPKEGGTGMRISWPASNNCLLCEENSMS